MSKVVAQSDADAFKRVLDRLIHDVGTILKLCGDCDDRGFNPGSAPSWALVRMTFPVAESIGDLIYRNRSTSANLISVLETDFEAVRAGHKGKAATLVQLFRHSLTHTDELRTLQTPNGQTVGWRLSYQEEATHLNVSPIGGCALGVSFDTTAFYKDIVAVCNDAMKKPWGSKAKDRYNAWLEHTLRSNTAAELMAIGEINQGLK